MKLSNNITVYLIDSHEYFLFLVPAAFLAINAEASTKNGNITKLRRLEINWYNIDQQNDQKLR